jgi:hypothetical protein
MRRILSILATACLFVSTILCGMQHSLDIQAIQDNAGLVGKLPQDIAIQIASYCNPQDRFALRCTGRFLNQQLQGPNYPQEHIDEEWAYIENKQEKNSLLFRRTKRDYRKAIKDGIARIHNLCLGLDATIRWILIGDFCINKLFHHSIESFCQRKSALSFAFRTLDTANKYAENVSLICLAIHYGSFVLRRLLNENFPLFPRNDDAGICTFFIRRPIAYAYGLAIHLMYCKTLKKQALRLFKTKQQYQSSNFGRKLGQTIPKAPLMKTLFNLDFPFNDYTWYMKGLYYIKNLILPSQLSLVINNDERAKRRLNASILQALPAAHVHHNA